MKRNPRTVRRGAAVGLAIASVAVLTACGTDPGRRLGRAARPPPSSARWRARSRSSRGRATSRTAQRPRGRLGHPASRRTPAARSHQDLRHLRRGAQPHEDRRIRRGLGLGRRVAPTGRRRRRRARQHRPDPELRGHLHFLKDQSWNSVDGVPYGVPHGYGANLLMYNTEVVPDRRPPRGTSCSTSRATTPAR